VTLDSFEIDRTEISVARYQRCVAAGACSPATFPFGDARYDQPHLPVTHVRWEDARAYCTWVSGRLPTEAEWEFTARGRANRTFPWGELYNPRLSNHGTRTDWVDRHGEDPTDGRDGFRGLAPIGSFPDGASANGVLDLAGNVSEWVHDLFDIDADGMGYSGKVVTNPKGPPSGHGHVIRGGSYRDGAHWQRSAARRSNVSPFSGAAFQSSREVGFRCAYDLQG
jgi:formylglycine-generating enzyme required for sulfatase activity